MTPKEHEAYLLWLTKLQPGDQFAQPQHYGEPLLIHTVARTTRAQIITEEGIRFGKGTGRPLGKPGMRRIKPLTAPSREEGMSDRDLLLLAAKAAGLTPYEHVDGLIVTGSPETHDVDYERWNPLTDDGDAFRLAVQLRIPVLFSALQGHTVAAVYQPEDLRQPVHSWALYGGDLAATRRAIVEEAVEIGRKNLRYRK